jgi:hypothetical protein
MYLKHADEILKSDIVFALQVGKTGDFNLKQIKNRYQKSSLDVNARIDLNEEYLLLCKRDNMYVLIVEPKPDVEAQ